MRSTCEVKQHQRRKAIVAKIKERPLFHIASSSILMMPFAFEVLAKPDFSIQAPMTLIAGEIINADMKLDETAPCVLSSEAGPTLDWPRIQDTDALEECLMKIAELFVATPRQGSSQIAALLTNSGFTAVNEFERERRNANTLEYSSNIGIEALIEAKSMPSSVSNSLQRLLGTALRVNIQLSGASTLPYPQVQAHISWK
jgi:hypothetical protein